MFLEIPEILLAKMQPERAAAIQALNEKQNKANRFFNIDEQAIQAEVERSKRP